MYVQSTIGDLRDFRWSLPGISNVVNEKELALVHSKYVERRTYCSHCVRTQTSQLPSRFPHSNS